MGSIYVICSRQCPNGDGIYTLLYALYKYSTSITNQPTNRGLVEDMNMEKQSQGCYKTMQLVFVTAITKKTMDIQNGLPDGTKPLSPMLTVRSNDIHLRSVSQEIFQPTTTNFSCSSKYSV